MEYFPDINKISQNNISKQVEAINLAQRNAMKLSITNSQIFKPNINLVNNISHFNFDEIFNKTNIVNISKTYNYNSQYLLKITEQFRNKISKQVKIDLAPLYRSVQKIDSWIENNNENGVVKMNPNGLKIDSWTENINENGIVKMNPNGLKIESYSEIYTTSKTESSTSNNTNTSDINTTGNQKEIYRDMLNKLATESFEHSLNRFFYILNYEGTISYFFLTIIFLQIVVALATAEKKTDKLDDE
ncbi:hypothetical protein [Mammaliicoccus lentus]|uniref:hypothetical protein n=1 Tax=Mammaliicoccus lentus TaxID=42858 RepID=UPI002DBD5169|nr:hypothetical protein [Mammaliicoccus lentus]MEB8091859.1 hypothetical protein [Mammaliicoccus lentus]